MGRLRNTPCKSPFEYGLHGEIRKSQCKSFRHLVYMVIYESPHVTLVQSGLHGDLRIAPPKLGRVGPGLAWNGKSEQGLFAVCFLSVSLAIIVQ